MYLKSYIQFHLFFLQFFLKWLLSVNFDKTSSGRNKRQDYQKNKQNFYWQDMFGKKCFFTISIKICFFLLFWSAEKVTYFKFRWNFTKKIGKSILKKKISPSFDMLHSSPMVYMNHTELMFLGSTFILHQEGPKKSQYFFTFVTGWNTVAGACSDLDVNV